MTHTLNKEQGMSTQASPDSQTRAEIRAFMSCQHVNTQNRSLHLQSDQPPHVAESRGPPAPLAQGPGASLSWLKVGQVCVYVCMCVCVCNCCVQH